MYSIIAGSQEFILKNGKYIMWLSSEVVESKD